MGTIARNDGTATIFEGFAPICALVLRGAADVKNAAIITTS